MANAITVTYASGLLDTVFGKLQAPLASYIRQFGGIQKPEEELWDKVFEKKSNILRVVAHTTIVVIDSKTGKMYRRIPENIYNEFLKASI